MKKVLCVLLAFLLVVCGTVAADILKENQENYAVSPYRKSAAEEKTLDYNDLFFVSSLEEPVYTVGSNAHSKEQMALIEALDGAGQASAAVRVYSRAEFIAFQKLLQRLTFRPAEGFKSVLLSRLSNHRNSIATFQLNSRYYSGNTEPYQDVIGIVPVYTSSIAGQKDRVEGGVLFSWRGHVYLDAYLVPRSEYDETLQMEVPAVWDEYKTVFEILPSDALDELLAQREFYASGIDKAETGMGPFLKRKLIRETRLFAVILLLVVLYEIGRKKNWWKKLKEKA